MENASVSRPWQGTLLGVVNIIGIIALGIIVLFLFGGAAMFAGLEQSDQTGAIFSLMSTIGTFILIPFVLFFVLEIFITIGIFKGQKWTIILSLILTILSIASLFFGSSEMSAPALVINALMLYTEIICIKHPFYS